MAEELGGQGQIRSANSPPITPHDARVSSTFGESVWVAHLADVAVVAERGGLDVYRQVYRPRLSTSPIPASHASAAEHPV